MIVSKNNLLLIKYTFINRLIFHGEFFHTIQLLNYFFVKFYV